MVQCLATTPSTALLDRTTRARRRATRTRSHTRWGWRSNANLARAAQQALAHIVVTTISTLLARLALRLTRWWWWSNANLARAAQQALAHIVVTTISTLLARLALRLTRWWWWSNANLARAAQQALAHIVVTTISTLLARLALRLARGLKARDELAALCVPLTAHARWQVNVATPPAPWRRNPRIVTETLAFQHLVASLRASRNRCALLDVYVVDFVGAMASVAIQRKVALVAAPGIPI